MTDTNLTQLKLAPSELHANLKALEAMKEDLVLPARGLGLRAEGNLALAFPSLHDIEFPAFDGIITSSGADSVLTESVAISPTAHQQIGDRYNIPRAYYTRMQREAPELLARNVNHWLGVDDRGVLVRTYRMEQGGYARAVLSDRYRIVDNLEVFFAVCEELDAKNINARFTHSDLTEDRMYVRIEFPDLQEDFEKLITRDGMHNWHTSGSDPWFGGLIVSNSETGNGSVSIKPRLIRKVCSNGAIIEHAVLKQFHLGSKLNEGFYEGDRTRTLENEILFSRIKDVVAQLCDPDLFRQFLGQFTATATTRLAHPVAAATNVATHLGLSDERRNQLLERFVLQDASTQYGIADAVTWLAHDYETVDADMAVSLETYGGKILTTAPAEFQRTFDHTTN